MKSCCDRTSFGKHVKCYVAKLLETRTPAELLSSRKNATVVVEALLSVILNMAALFLNCVLCWAVYKNHRLRRMTSVYVLGRLFVMSAFTESGGTPDPLVNFKHSVASC